MTVEQSGRECKAWKSTGAFIFMLLLSLAAISCTHAAKPDSPDYDVILTASPLSVKSIEPGVAVDAIEKGAIEDGSADKVVVFDIDAVKKGKFTKVREGGPSKMEQAKDALKEFDLLKVLALDFDDPDDWIEKRWLSIAVKNPNDSFGITDWDRPEGGRHKIYLKRLADDPDSYIMTASEPLKD